MTHPVSPPDHRWTRAIGRFGRHIVRVDALRAFAVAVLAFGVVVWIGSDKPVGQAGLVVIGTLVTYILLPEQPHRFWRVQAQDLARSVPPSDLRAAGRETAKALSLQTGGTVEATYAASLWDDAAETVALAVSDPRRVVVDMDYRITVARGPFRQLVRATISSKRCWPGATQVFFSFCSDVDALSAEFAAEGSFSREIVEPEPGEHLDAWEHRVALFPVTLVVDGRKIEPALRENRQLGTTSRAHRIVFDVTGTAVTEHYTPIQLTSEFHQASSDRNFTVKFSTYWCVGWTEISFEVNDPTCLIIANDFMLDPSRDTEFFHHFGLASHRVTLQTRGDAVLHPGSGVLFSWAPGELLARIPEVLENLLPEGIPLPALPGLPSALVPTSGSDEPLVPITVVRCIDAYHRLGVLDSARVLKAREEVVRRLLNAHSLLPPDFGLVVLDGWRDSRLQAELVKYYEELHGRSVEGYVADPASTTLRPPHVVGGALDLTLSFRSQPLALGTPYDDFSAAAHLDAFEGNDSTVRRLRRLLAEVMLQAGFAPFALEWWHWSYGDDVWAIFRGCDALYDVVSDGES